MATRTINVTANSIEELQSKAPNIALQGGSVGRLEIYAPRVLGVCPAPLGLAMSAPGVGTLLAQKFAPTGAVVTDRGGIGGAFSCDAYVSWQVPVTQGQTAVMGLVIALVVVLGALAAVLLALGWAISQLKLLVQAVVDAFGGPTGLLLAGAGLLAVVGLSQFGKKRKR